MLVLAVIPARLGAARLPRKPLRLLGGLPLVVRVYQRVIALQSSDECVVATDAPEVIDVCARHGVPAVLTSAEHPSGTDRVAEVASHVAFSAFDVILNVQGDEPFVSADAVRGAVRIVTSGQAAIGTACTLADAEILSRPDVVKVIRTDDGRALYFSRAPIPYLRDSADTTMLTGNVRQHIGVYAYTRVALQQWVTWPPHALEQIERLEQLRPLAHGLAIGVADATAGERGIDTEEDLVRANARWTELHTADSPMSARTTYTTPSLENA